MKRIGSAIPLLLGMTALAADGRAFGRAQRSVSSTRDAGSTPASAMFEDSRAAELARIRNDEEAGHEACLDRDPVAAARRGGER